MSIAVSKDNSFCWHGFESAPDGEVLERWDVFQEPVPEPGKSFHQKGWVFDSRGYPRWCKKCGFDEFYSWVAYPRKVRTLRGTIAVPVNRFQCKACKVTVVQYFDFVEPGKWYGKDIQRSELNAFMGHNNSTRESVNWVDEEHETRVSNSTVWRWMEEKGEKAEQVMQEDILPAVHWNAQLKFQADELYCKGRNPQSTQEPNEKSEKKSGKLSILAGMIYQYWFIFYAFISPQATTQEAIRLLRFLQDRLVDVRCLISDGSDIWANALQEVFPNARHLICVFHKMANILDTQTAIQRLFENPYLSKRKLNKELDKLLKRLNNQIGGLEKQIGQFKDGYITNNHLERHFRFLRAYVSRIIAFGSTETGNKFLSLFVLYWNLRPFQRGKKKGLCPAQLAGFDPQRKDWLEWLGIPTYEALNRMIREYPVIST